jgi:hypothetical protein
MLFAAATDHRFIDVGHALDFTNKALEALDKLEWENKSDYTYYSIVSNRNRNF